MIQKPAARFFIACFVLFSLFNCTRNPYAATNRSYKKQAKALARQIRQVPPSDSVSKSSWVGTTNFNLRKPNYVIIHHTAQNSCEQTLKTFTTAKSSVSAHYVICKDGTVHHMLNDYLRAWHGGLARWGNTTDINSASIGIEIDNNGTEAFTDQQIGSLLALLEKLRKNYGIPTANFIGHSDIAPTRKVDPNVNFPWKTLADKGFGLWWSDTAALSLPAGFNAIQALRIVGYDTRDSAAAIRAFKRKFLQQEGNAILSEDDKKVLFSLYRKSE
ncbi:MAG TPA: N-acetylmuramoyl-L-alanine amidase [Flavisolibacter sp.]|nr:N-acetylmuramoyl-L-alanine amidase [Flavisolibacter sp.]